MKINNINELIGKHIEIYQYYFYVHEFLNRNIKFLQNINLYKKEGVVLYVKENDSFKCYNGKYVPVKYSVEVVLLKQNEYDFRNENGELLTLDDLILKRINGRIMLYENEFWVLESDIIKR